MGYRDGNVRSFVIAERLEVYDRTELSISLRLVPWIFAAVSVIALTCAIYATWGHARLGGSVLYVPLLAYGAGAALARYLHRRRHMRGRGRPTTLRRIGGDAEIDSSSGSVRVPIDEVRRATWFARSTGPGDHDRYGTALVLGTAGAIVCDKELDVEWKTQEFVTDATYTVDEPMFRAIAEALLAEQLLPKSRELTAESDLR